MKILTLIDSESYSDVLYYAFETKEEAIKLVANFADETMKLETEENKYGTRIVYDDGKGYFVVGQTFEVPDYLPYVVVKHHAYDGVDFDMVGSARDFSDAKLVCHAAAADLVDDIDSIDYDGDDQFIYDNGNEWDVVTVLDFSMALAQQKTKEAA